MRALVPGHLYYLDVVDAPEVSAVPSGVTLRFVRRGAERYPDMTGSLGPPHDGTTTQEVLRALIDRQRYLDGQRAHWTNPLVVTHLRGAIQLIEHRAADERHDQAAIQRVVATRDVIETIPACPGCGHLFCGRRH